MPRPRAHRSAQKSLAPPPLLGPRLKKWAVRRLARSHSGPAHKAFLSGRVGSGGPDDYIPGPRADAFPRFSRRRPIETRLIRPSERYSDWTVRMCWAQRIDFATPRSDDPRGAGPLCAQQSPISTSGASAGPTTASLFGKAARWVGPRIGRRKPFSRPRKEVDGERLGGVGGAAMLSPKKSNPFHPVIIIKKR